MIQICATASATIDAPAQAVYSILADYREAHPRILPQKYLRNLEVEQGGTSAGTVFSIETHMLGVTRTLRGVVAEPEPGRILTETYEDTDQVTTFIVEPLEAGGCEVTIRTEYTSDGLSGLVERFLVPPLLRRIYAEELHNLAGEATSVPRLDQRIAHASRASPMSLTIQRMQPTHAEQLTIVAHAAKRLWDYPAALIEQWKEELTLTPEAIEDLLVFGALNGEKIVGFYALSGAGPARELEHLWILPECIGQGIGRTLFRHALWRITAEGASTLRIVSDPHAEGFYKRMGAQRIGEVPSAPTGRMLPVLEMTIEEGTTA